MSENGTIAGNAAAMREALEHCIEELQPYCDGGGRKDDVLEEAKSALAAPPRNCDVGTEKEQADRFLDFCLSHKGCKSDAIKCPVAGKCDCELAWAQMPYEEAERK